MKLTSSSPKLTPTPKWWVDLKNLVPYKTQARMSHPDIFGGAEFEMVWIEEAPITPTMWSSLQNIPPAKN